MAIIVTLWNKILITLLRCYRHHSYSLKQNSYYVIMLLRPPLLLLEIKILLRYYAVTATIVTPWSKILITLLRYYVHHSYSLKQDSYYVIMLLRSPFLLFEVKFLLHYYAVTATILTLWSKILITLLWPPLLLLETKILMHYVRSSVIA